MSESIIITDPTLPGYNAFVSVAEADAYFGTTYWAPGEITWDSQTPEDKDRLLISASRAISALPWHGVPAYPDQMLAFPRYFSIYGYFNGSYYPTCGVPTPVVTQQVPDNPSWLKPLTLEYAKWLFQEKGFVVAQNDHRGIKKMDVDTLSITYQDDAKTTGSDFVSTLPISILALLNKLSPWFIDMNKSKVKSMSMVF